MGFTVTSTGFDEVARTFSPLKGAEDVRVIAKADYGVFVDSGTSRMPPQPFSRPGTAKALMHFAELEARAKNLQMLVNLLAAQIAKEWKAIVPVDTGALRDSIEVEEK